ncbi:MAG: hydroxymethylbilane synthase [Alphaproteobacteria bacterium]|nr:hydroxymethylbilane synthase [Alphaproteobacteria bacterium]
MTEKPIRIGTRGSRLALWQANAVRNRFAAHGLAPEAIEVVPIRTSGDVIRDRPLSEAGGKGLFSKEIEAALLAGSIDLAVHSAKDMETILPAGLMIGACLEREDVRDALIARGAASLDDLPQGARVGSASLRREALLRRVRPDLRIELLRGNVPTRVAKVETGEIDATLLAAAGLKRIGLEAKIASLLPLESFPPACGQGTIAIECREDDARIRDLLLGIDHRPSSRALVCERAFLAALDGSCKTPIAGYARIDGLMLRFDGMILSEDGRESYAASVTGDPGDAAGIGHEAGQEIRRKAPDAFLQRLGIG